MKRGSIAIWGVVLTVILVAGIGLLYVQTEDAQPNPYAVHVDYMTCRQNCFSSYDRQRPQIANCLAMCAQPSEQPVPDVGAVQYPTGQFAGPAVKEYGGAIRSISQGPGAAFPGRAVQMPTQDCYACNCQPYRFGITSSTSDAAEQACMNNCDGTISMVHSNECSELELARI